MTKRPTESMQAPEVLTLTEAAEYLRVAESELSKLASERAVPCQRIGEEWRFHKPALIGWLAGSEAPKRGSKEAVMEYFGIFRDDDDLEEQLAKLRSYRDSTDTEDEE